MSKTWQEIVNAFPTTPYFFVGSGLTRRYLDLPNWESLLKHFAEKLSSDPFSYQSYSDKANKDLPTIGTLIEKDYNEKWYSTPEFRTNNNEVFDAVHNGCSPFKAEVAHFISQSSIHKKEYIEEIESLRSLTDSNISGFITTNYDNFLESITQNYKVYTGQEELIFSPIQEIAEIFKIHGTITNPKSLVLTQKDYQEFNSKSKYLAAKLMTIFMEYPIIFIGYSLTDSNIQNILTSMVECLSEENIQKLQHRFIFVKRNEAYPNSIHIGEHSQTINGHQIFMTRLETANYKLIYDALKEKKAGMPVRILRFLKEQFHNYTITNKPSKHIFVNPYDPTVSDDQICFSIGQNSESVIQGLIGITAEHWYKDVLFGNVICYPPDSILSQAFYNLVGANNTLPIFKYLSLATLSHKDVITKTNVNCFNDLLNSNIRKYQNNSHITERSVVGIRKQFTSSDKISFQTLYYMQFLREDEIVVEDLERFLIDFYEENPEILKLDYSDSNAKSNFKRLIRIFDWLKYGRNR